MSWVDVKENKFPKHNEEIIFLDIHDEYYIGWYDNNKKAFIFEDIPVPLVTHWNRDFKLSKKKLG